MLHCDGYEHVAWHIGFASWTRSTSTTIQCPIVVCWSQFSFRFADLCHQRRLVTAADILGTHLACHSTLLLMFNASDVEVFTLTSAEAAFRCDALRIHGDKGDLEAPDEVGDFVCVRVVTMPPTCTTH